MYLCIKLITQIDINMNIKRKVAAIAAVLMAVSATAQTNPLWMRFSAISPDGQTIAFSYKGDLFTVPVLGGTAHQLTTNAAYDAYPVWSPDGQQVAFASAREGSLDVYIISKDGGTPKRLTTDSGNETPLCFLDDGTVQYAHGAVHPVCQPLVPPGVSGEHQRRPGTPVLGAAHAGPERQRQWRHPVSRHQGL